MIKTTTFTTLVTLAATALAQGGVNVMPEVMPVVSPGVMPGVIDPCADIPFLIDPVMLENGTCVNGTDAIILPMPLPIEVSPTPSPSTTPSEEPVAPSATPSPSPEEPEVSILPVEPSVTPSPSPEVPEVSILPVEPSITPSPSPEEPEVSILPVEPSFTPSPSPSKSGEAEVSILPITPAPTPTPSAEEEASILPIDPSPTPTASPNSGCAPVMCMMQCDERGYVLDDEGCNTCECVSDAFITCAQKEEESPMGCEELNDDLECCRYGSGRCPGLTKCTPSKCCIYATPTPTPHPTPSSTPSYEPVDNYINCAVKEYEGGFKCTGDEGIDAEKECCRWSDKCGDLRKCTENYCCTESSPTPKPSPSAQPVDYTIKCKEKYGLYCPLGHEMEEDKNCCKYPGACGNLRSCRTDFCCDLAGPLPPPDTVGACKCDGAVVDEECYSTIERAIRAASDGDTIYVGGDIEVDSPITFEQSLSFSGVLCDGERAQIIATFDEIDRAMFEAVNEDTQEVNFLHLAMTSEGDNSASAFHSLGDVTNAPDQGLTLNMTNVWVHDMYNQRPGVGVFVGTSKGLYIDNNCVFHNLNMTTSEEGLYAGGAAVAVAYLPRDSEITIAGVFTNNTAFYPDASKHSGGGAIYMDYMEGDIKFTATFQNNSANQGGAVNVQGVFGYMIVDGYFSENHAIDDGYGSRAGAFRLLKIEDGGKVLFNGSFIGNTAQGRGGAIATNMHEEGSKMYLDGIFQNNVASTVGGVWSMWSNNQMNGNVKLFGDSIFEGNLAVQDNSRSSIYDIAVSGDGNDKLSESEWYGDTIYIN